MLVHGVVVVIWLDDTIDGASVPTKPTLLNKCSLTLKAINFIVILFQVSIPLFLNLLSTHSAKAYAEITNILTLQLSYCLVSTGNTCHFP